MPIGFAGKSRVNDGLIDGNEYIAFFSGSTPSYSTEISASGYARTAIPFSKSSNSQNAHNTNSLTITASSDWGNVQSYAIMNTATKASSLSAFNNSQLFYDSISRITVNNGDRIQIAAQGIQVSWS
jgi:hypothetical protein